MRGKEKKMEISKCLINVTCYLAKRETAFGEPDRSGNVSACRPWK